MTERIYILRMILAYTMWVVVAEWLERVTRTLQVVKGLWVRAHLSPQKLPRNFLEQETYSHSPHPLRSTQPFIPSGSINRVATLVAKS